MYWLYRLLVWIFCFLAIKRGNDWNLLRKVALYKYWLVCKNTLKDLRIAFIISLSLYIYIPSFHECTPQRFTHLCNYPHVPVSNFLLQNKKRVFKNQIFLDDVFIFSSLSPAGPVLLAEQSNSDSQRIRSIILLIKILTHMEWRTAAI